MDTKLGIWLAVVILALPIASEGCTIVDLSTEYSEGVSNSRSVLNYDGATYSLVHYADERYVIVKGLGCDLIKDEELNKDLITNGLLIEETRTTIGPIISNYGTIHGCYSLTEYSNGVCAVVGVLQSIYDSAASGALDLAGTGIVNVIGMVDAGQKKGAQSLYKKILRFVKKGKEKQAVKLLFDTCEEIKADSGRICGLSEDSQKKSGELKNGSIKSSTLQDISNNNQELIGYLDHRINEANIDRIAGYISTEAVDTIKNEVNSMISENGTVIDYTDREQLDPIGIMLTLNGGEKCSGFRKNGEIYNSMKNFQTQIDKSIEQGIASYKKSTDYLVEKRTAALLSIQMAEKLKAEINPGILSKSDIKTRYDIGMSAFAKANQDLNNNLYISAKRDADEAAQYFGELKGIKVENTNDKNQSVIDTLSGFWWVLVLMLLIAVVTKKMKEKDTKP